MEEYDFESFKFRIINGNEIQKYWVIGSNFKSFGNGGRFIDLFHIY